MNTSVAGGNEITIDRDYLYHLLTVLEKTQYDHAYQHGYDNAMKVHYNELPIDKNFEGSKRKW